MLVATRTICWTLCCGQLKRASTYQQVSYNHSAVERTSRSLNANIISRLNRFRHSENLLVGVGVQRAAHTAEVSATCVASSFGDGLVLIQGMVSVADVLQVVTTPQNGNQRRDWGSLRSMMTEAFRN